MTKLVILRNDMGMKTVRVAELKARLSEDLRMARGGEEIVVLDRNTPIARTMPLAEPAEMTQEERLIASGVLRAPTRPKGETRYIPNPVKLAKSISPERWQAMWDEERADRV